MQKFRILMHRTYITIYTQIIYYLYEHIYVPLNLGTHMRMHVVTPALVHLLHVEQLAAPHQTPGRISPRAPAQVGVGVRHAGAVAAARRRALAGVHVPDERVPVGQLHVRELREPVAAARRLLPATPQREVAAAPVGAARRLEPFEAVARRDAAAGAAAAAGAVAAVAERAAVAEEAAVAAREPGVGDPRRRHVAPALQVEVAGVGHEVVHRRRSGGEGEGGVDLVVGVDDGGVDRRRAALLVVAVHHVTRPHRAAPVHARPIPDLRLQRPLRVDAEREAPRRRVAGALPGDDPHAGVRPVVDAELHAGHEHVAGVLERLPQGGVVGQP
ncbi:Os09g0550400 [Oryza sativa Japonica Group]|uniref:Os09g0550400 protein n=1 Tax=Oryza sativa subsp. japonica TaxID=39947 RepID=A0A0P0XQ64_ORYSJ|nr:hypothetical protein EE612_049351 [Oryza sativa]BAT09294.1 Os09g0550400 [Oryza sativa Japonica Group]